MLDTLTFRALGIHARRVLDFLEREQMAHGGQENGNLAATYRQLAEWGVTRNDVSLGFAELQATGFVRLTHQGSRVAGGGEPSRYALTWLQTREAGVVERSTDEWRTIAATLTRSGVTTVAQARRWLKEETGGGRSARSPKPTPPRY